jgi:hypothetical protein
MLVYGKGTGYFWARFEGQLFIDLKIGKGNEYQPSWQNQEAARPGMETFTLCWVNTAQHSYGKWAI